QQVAGGVDGRLHFLLGHVQLHIQAEAQGDHRGAAGTGGGHLLQAGHLAEAALQRRGHRTGHHLRTGARIQGHDADGRVVHFRQRRHRQHAVGDHPHDEDGRHQQGGGHRAQDEGPRDVHASRLAVAGVVSSITCTGEPSRRRSVPSSTRRSPGCTPDSMTVHSPLLGPARTRRSSTLSPSPPTYTKAPREPYCRAAEGISRDCSSVLTRRRTLTNWLGNSRWSLLAKRALRRRVPVAVSIWLSRLSSWPVARIWRSARSQASTLRVCPARSCSSTWGTSPSGRVKLTAIGSVWVMVTSTALSLLVSRLPRSTWRRPRRPEMGARIRVNSRFRRASSTAACWALSCP